MTDHNDDGSCSCAECAEIRRQNEVVRGLMLEYQKYMDKALSLVKRWHNKAAELREKVSAIRHETLAAVRREVEEIVNYKPPVYAYGDNEAACDMADRLDTILAIIDRLEKEAGE